MNDISFFNRYARLRARRYFSHKLAAKIITACLFLSLITGIAIAVYIGVHVGFMQMNQQAYGRQTLPFYTYEIFFLVMSYLMLLSAIASTFFSIARRNDEWIAATPKFKMLLTNAVRSVFLSSLWPLLVLGLPAILALRSVYGGGVMFIFAGLIGLVLVAAIVCSLAVALVLLIAEILQAFNALRMKRLVSVVLVCVVIASYIILRQIIAMNIVSLFVSGPLTASVAGISGIATAFRFLPTQLMAFLMLNLQNGAIGAAWENIGILAIIAAIIGLILYLLSFGYLHVWQKLAEGSFEARTQATSIKTASAGWLNSGRTATGAIFYKETITNTRNLKNAAWLSFMLALWIIQTSLNIFLRRNITQYGVHAMTIASDIQSLQLLTATFFVSALVLRFVLPSFSGERRVAWILGTAPISWRKIFFSKLTFYGALFIILGLVLGIANSVILGASLMHAAEFLAVLAVMIACVTTFGFTLGALFPDTESDDPEVVSTSLPGLAFTFVSLLYGGFGAWLYYQGLNSGSSTGMEFFALISLFIIIGMIATASERLKMFNPFAKEFS